MTMKKQTGCLGGAFELLAWIMDTVLNLAHVEVCDWICCADLWPVILLGI
jgi:hypothetical protein